MNLNQKCIHEVSVYRILDLIFDFQVLSELPFHTFFVAVYAVPVYFIAGLKLNVEDFLTVFAILFLLVYCSRTLAMFSAAVMPTFQLGCFFAQTFFSMYIMSAGFFINLDNIFDGKLVVVVVVLLFLDRVDVFLIMILLY